MIDVSIIYSTQDDAISALQDRYCNGNFYSDRPALFFSAVYDHLVAGDTLYVLSGNSYVVAAAGFYAVYPFTESGEESFIQIDSTGKYVGTTIQDVHCTNPGDFNSDFGSDFNM
jgi:hypothetical protein